MIMRCSRLNLNLDSIAILFRSQITSTFCFCFSVCFQSVSCLFFVYRLIAVTRCQELHRLTHRGNPIRNSGLLSAYMIVHCHSLRHIHFFISQSVIVNEDMIGISVFAFYSIILVNLCDSSYIGFPYIYCCSLRK